MGLACDLKEVFWFVYKAPFDNGLTEHELDHVMVGYFNDDPVINKEEVESFKWMTLRNVKIDMKKYPENYTEWFKIIFKEYYQRLV